MILQVVLHTVGGVILGKESDVTDEEKANFREDLQTIFTGAQYVELDTDEGWVVVPVNQIQYIEAIEGN